jgi:hypothetical protein
VVRYEEMQVSAILTSLANRLLAARESEGIDGQSTADGASKLDGDLILGQGAVISLAMLQRHTFARVTDLMSSS